MSNDFLPWATAGGANVEAQATYAADPKVGTGESSGTANSARFNKSLRQASWWSYVMSLFIVQELAVSVADDGNSTTALLNMTNAIKQAALSAGGAGGGTGVKGAVNLIGSAAGGTKTAAWTVDEMTAETALGGTSYKGASLSLSFNGAGANGAGAMDTGSTPVSGDLSIYLIVNPSGPTFNTLGVAGGTSNGTIYSGAHMPAGYTASALLWSGKTDGSGNIVAFDQLGNHIGIVFNLIFNGASGVAALTSQSISPAVPANAKAVSGVMAGGTVTSVNTQAIVASDSTGLGSQASSVTAGAIGGYSNGVNFVDLILKTAQTIFWNTLSASSPGCFLEISGYTI